MRKAVRRGNSACRCGEERTAPFAFSVIYAGYKFNDWIVLNNEFEFEHATTGEGSEEKGEVSVEFSQTGPAQKRGKILIMNAVRRYCREQ